MGGGEVCHVCREGRGGPAEGGVPAAQGALWIATRMGKGRRTQRGQSDGADRTREKQGRGNTKCSPADPGGRKGHKKAREGVGASVRLPGLLVEWSQSVLDPVTKGKITHLCGLHLRKPGHAHSNPPRAQGLETLSVAGNLKLGGPDLFGGKETLLGQR